MAHTSKQVLPEPRWISLNHLRSVMMPPRVSAWVRDRGSLTRALLNACDGRFQVDVRAQGWGRSLPGERLRLDMSPGLLALVREVKLLCDDSPWVFARTLIPVTSLRGAARQLAHLGSRPLGALLFSDPSTRRLGIEVARLTPQHTLFHAACSHLETPPAEIWGRRTLFAYAGKRLLVNEIFLPAIPARRP